MVTQTLDGHANFRPAIRVAGWIAILSNIKTAPARMFPQQKKPRLKAGAKSRENQVSEEWGNQDLATTGALKR
jgi:hypothetical protein